MIRVAVSQCKVDITTGDQFVLATFLGQCSANSAQCQQLASSSLHSQCMAFNAYSLHGGFLSIDKNHPTEVSRLLLNDHKYGQPQTQIQQ